MLTGEGIVCVSSIDWDSKRQGHQEIMSALAAAGNEVLFIENTGARSPTLRDWPRLYRRIRNAGRGWRGLREERERLTVHAPLVLPFPYSRMARAVNSLLLTRVCRRWSARVGKPRPILWVFLPTPVLGDLIGALQPAITIYHCVDDLPASSPGAGRIRQSEEALLRTADLVFVTTESLRRRAARFRRQVDVFPVGVNMAPFDRARSASIERPSDIRDLPEPVVGYVGGVNQKTDQALLAAVARRLPRTQFVLIGPIQADASVLAACPNVHLLGYRPWTALPGYLKAMRAGLIPYRVNDYTAYIFPAKLNEYFAMGLPVVATRLPELERYNAAHGEVVALADDADEFCAALSRALEDRSASRVQQRVALARANGWERRLPAMLGLVGDALATHRGRRAALQASFS